MMRINFLIIFIFILTSLINSISFASEKHEDDKDIIQEFIDATCSCEYSSCLGISKDDCERLISTAINKCPMKYIEKLDMEVFDAPCITNKFSELVNTSIENLDDCQKHLPDFNQKK